ncbi:hypothetical protein T03_5137, partial [Trichinella britovi]
LFAASFLHLTFAADAMVFTIRRSLASTILLVIPKFTMLRLGGPNIRAKSRFRLRA